MRGILELELNFEFAGQRQTIWPTLIVDSDNALLIDAAYPGQLTLLEEAEESFRKLLSFAPETVYCSHGGAARAYAGAVNP